MVGNKNDICDKWGRESCSYSVEEYSRKKEKTVQRSWDSSMFGVLEDKKEQQGQDIVSKGGGEVREVTAVQIM